MNTETTDMTTAIVPKSDQINADDFIGGPQTYTIAEVVIRGGEQPVSIYFTEHQKPWKPCKSMCRVLVGAWGADAKAYAGRSLTLYRDQSVKWAGMAVGGIRVSHMTGLTEDFIMMLSANKKERKPHVVKPLVLQKKAAAPPTPPAGPTAAEIDDARAKLTNAATHGTDILRAAWESLTKPVQKVLQPEMPALKQKANEMEVAA